METSIIVILVIITIVSLGYAKIQKDNAKHWRKIANESYRNIDDLKKKLINEQIKNQER